MSCTLTEYRRPTPRYGLGRLAQHAWRALGGWRQLEGGGCGRVYTCGRRSFARRAVIFRAGGWWLWRVEEFDLGTRALRRVAARNAAGRGYMDPAAAMPFADLAALSE